MKTLKSCLMLGIIAAGVSSCGTSSLYLESFAPEESGLNLVKITDESNNSVLAGGTRAYYASTNYTLTARFVM